MSEFTSWPDAIAFLGMLALGAVILWLMTRD